MNRLSPENLERRAHEIVDRGAFSMVEIAELAEAYIASRSANRLALEIIDRAGAMVWSDTRVAVFDALFFAGACNALEQALKMGDAFEREPEELEALRRFKAYVHQRLDEAGVPTHPEGPHSAVGCRVGDRLDIALRVVPASRRVLDGLYRRIDAADAEAVPVFEGIAELTDALHEFGPATAKATP